MAKAPPPTPQDAGEPPLLLAVGHAILDLLYRASAEETREAGMLPDDTLLLDAAQHAALRGKLGEPEGSACGGSAVNALITAARLGARGGLVCRVGADEAGRRYLAELAEAGIEARAEVAEGERTGQTLVLSTPPDHRSMATCLGASGGLSAANAAGGIPEGVSWVLLEGYLLSDPAPCELAMEVLRQARERGVPVALTLAAAAVVAANKHRFREMLDAGVQLLLGNAAEAAALTGVEGVQASIRQLAQLVPAGVITDGPAGAWGFTDRGSLWEVPAEKAREVDALGAGDCFAGGFLAAYMRDGDMGRALALGAKAGALGVGHWGPRPPAEAVEEIHPHWQPPASPEGGGEALAAPAT